MVDNDKVVVLVLNGFVVSHKLPSLPILTPADQSFK